MFSFRWRTSLFWMLWLAGMVGCKSLFAPRGVPDDPLILSKKPIESRGQVTPAQPVVHQEPVPPGEKPRS